MNVLNDMGDQVEYKEEGVFKWKIGETSVYFYEDPGLFITQIAIRGKNRERVANQLQERIPVHTPAEMPGLFAEIKKEKNEFVIQDLFRVYLNILASVAPEKADPLLVSLFKKGFDYKDPSVRELALLAAYRTISKER
jgi:hypothetical protein